MTHVLVVESLNEDIFVCGLCKFVFNSLSLFLEHKKVCMKSLDSLWPASSNTVLENDSSILGTSDSTVIPSDKDRTSDLEPVNIPHSTEKPVKCEVCFKSFQKEKSLNAHLKSHKKLSQCLLCGRCFLCNSHLKRHIMTHKVWPSGLNETTPKSPEVDFMNYSCPYCTSLLGNYGQFRAHLNIHISLKKFKCIQGECTSFFETFKDVINHTYQCHEVKRYTCHICKIVFYSLEDIAFHQQNHEESILDNKLNEIPQYKCKLCDAIFRTQEKLSLHMLTENHKKICIHCNKNFASDKRLRMHLQIHRQLKPYKCNICGESFHMKKYLTSHATKHSSSQYPCNICKQTFKRKDILHRHKKTHMLSNSLKCPFRDVEGCVKEFTRKDKLKEHLKSHSKFLNTSRKRDV